MVRPGSVQSGPTFADSLLRGGDIDWQLVGTMKKVVSAGGWYFHAADPLPAQEGVRLAEIQHILYGKSRMPKSCVPKCGADQCETEILGLSARRQSSERRSACVLWSGGAGGLSPHLLNVDGAVLNLAGRCQYRLLKNRGATGAGRSSFKVEADLRCAGEADCAVQGVVFAVEEDERWELAAAGA